MYALSKSLAKVLKNLWNDWVHGTKQVLISWDISLPSLTSKWKTWRSCSALMSGHCTQVFRASDLSNRCCSLTVRKRWLLDWVHPTPTYPLLELLEVCLRSTYFSFQNRFYRLKDGVASGLPVALVVAKIFIDDLEEPGTLQTAWSPSPRQPNKFHHRKRRRWQFGFSWRVHQTR